MIKNDITLRIPNPHRKDITKELLARIIRLAGISRKNPDKKIDDLWAKEAEDRVDAYDQGKIKSVTLNEVLAKYK